MSTVSVIIPVYNKRDYLARCLDSIADQTAKPHQVILVDDGSTDGSGDLCDRYADEYRWEVYHTENRGVGAARNFGLDHARGDYVAFMDADDKFEREAIDTMSRIGRHDYNIYQFGHYRYLTGPKGVPRYKRPEKGHKGLDKIISYVSMVWNKSYKRSFLQEHHIRFREDMPFGEDEIFNFECVLANGGLYEAPQITASHYFDDKNSICRGNMCHDYVQCLYDALVELEKKQTDPQRKYWVRRALNRHYKSNLFVKYEVGQPQSGSYDIVYFLKNTNVNEELRYSLRSVEEYFPHRNVWFYGGAPLGFKPDGQVNIPLKAKSKWEQVRNMLLRACDNDDLTESFWLFNDDFFVLHEIDENMPQCYDGTLRGKIDEVEARHMGEHTDWTNRLRHLEQLLLDAGKPTLNYAVHKPLLVNRKKMKEVLLKYPDEPMSRALYGNYWEIGGADSYDTKLTKTKNQSLGVNLTNWDFVSTSDGSFRNGDIGKWLRQRFSSPSRFEV